MNLLFANEFSLFALLGVGFLLGLKHAVEADHLAAVSTIVAERRSLLGSAMVGGFWGIGHTITLLFIGALVIFFKFSISETLESKLEALVGAMLVILGLNTLRRLLKKEKIHVHSHDHDGHKHTHLHTHEDEKKEKTHHFAKFSPRSLLIGMIHGLAGSAALMLLIVPTIDSAGIAMIYILVFGIGSVGGMMLMSVLIGLPLHFTAQRFAAFNKTLIGFAGALSLCLGVFIVYEKLLA